MSPTLKAQFKTLFWENVSVFQWAVSKAGNMLEQYHNMHICTTGFQAMICACQYIFVSSSTNEILHHTSMSGRRKLSDWQNEDHCMVARWCRCPTSGSQASSCVWAIWLMKMCWWAQSLPEVQSCTCISCCSRVPPALWTVPFKILLFFPFWCFVSCFQCGTLESPVNENAAVAFHVSL